jgi:hypothetical protein
MLMRRPEPRNARLLDRRNVSPYGVGHSVPADCPAAALVAGILGHVVDDEFRC